VAAGVVAAREAAAVLAGLAVAVAAVAVAEVVVVEPAGAAGRPRRFTRLRPPGRSRW